MKQLYYLLFLSFLLLITSCNKQELQFTVHECAAMPENRACATCFVVNGQAYVFAGRNDNGTPQNDLWRYSPTTDSWENLGITPLTERVNATACVHEDAVYLGLGFYGKYGQDSSYLQDWWKYLPQSNTWERLADYPNHYTDRAVSFVGNGELYVGYGFCWNYRRDMFRYDITTNSWDSIDVGVGFNEYPVRSFGGTGCTCAGRHFMGTGFHGHSLNWWAELLTEGQWVEHTAVPGHTRTLAACGASKDYIYLCGGFHFGGVNTTGELLRDIQRYNPQNDEWQQVATMPKGLFNHICFSIDNRIFFGLGEDENWETNNKLYYIEE